MTSDVVVYGKETTTDTLRPLQTTNGAFEVVLDNTPPGTLVNLGSISGTPVSSFDEGETTKTPSMATPQILTTQAVGTLWRQSHNGLSNETEYHIEFANGERQLQDTIISRGYSVTFINPNMRQLEFVVEISNVVPNEDIFVEFSYPQSGAGSAVILLYEDFIFQNGDYKYVIGPDVEEIPNRQVKRTAPHIVNINVTSIPGNDFTSRITSNFFGVN